jgi:methionyl aminopeptidase
MRINSQNLFNKNEFIKLKNYDWLEKQRIAGRCVAKCLNYLEKEINGKTALTALRLSRLAEEFILDNKCIPTFKNYKGFPESVCISVNKELVHGIPKDIPFNSGDVISFDLGATYKGAIADSALTCIFDEPISLEHIRLIKATEEALMKGISAIAVGKRLGVIGNAIHKSAKGNGFASVNHYGGHGIDWHEPHAEPFVSNRSLPDEGIHIQSGLSIAIEPMLIIGNSNETKLSSDNWTVNAMNIGAHQEHTIFIHDDYIEIITDRSLKE